MQLEASDLFRNGTTIGEAQTAQRLQRRQRDFLGARSCALPDDASARRPRAGGAVLELRWNEQAATHGQIRRGGATTRVASFVEQALTATAGQPLPGSGGLEVPGSNPGARL
jgi:hypothetical protein